MASILASDVERQKRSINFASDDAFTPASAAAAAARQINSIRGFCHYSKQTNTNANRLNRHRSPSVVSINAAAASAPLQLLRCYYCAAQQVDLTVARGG